MRHALASFLFAAPICAFSAPALAQDYGPAGPVGAVVGAPFYAAGSVLAAPFGGWSGPSGGMTIASQTGTPTYSYGSFVPPSPAPGGHCDILSGNRVCFATP
jgi:hypothetical protein